MDDPKLEINILPAFHGDCIHLRFHSQGQCHNVVIDSGPGKHSAGFKRLMNGIRAAGEHVDLLCFTHMDDDHVLAAKHYFKTAENLDFVRQIWINIPNDEVQRAQKLKAGTDELTGAEKTFELFGHILRHGIPCKTEVLQGEKLYVGDMLIRAVLPTRELLTSYFDEWDKQMEKTKLTDAQSADDSDANGGSIVLVIEAMGNRLLFSGDAFAPNLEAISGTWTGPNGFALVKLPHHGSNANMSSSMLDAMNCRSFVISANGSMGRPAQKTVNILGQYGSEHGGVKLYGNYGWNDIDKVVGVTIKKLGAEPVPVTEGITLRTE